MHFGPLVAVTIGAVGVQNCCGASSLLVICQFLVGFGLGPLIVGALSDAIEPTLGVAALCYAMLLAPAAVAAGWLLVTAYRRMGVPGSTATALGGVR